MTKQTTAQRIVAALFFSIVSMVAGMGCAPDPGDLLACDHPTEDRAVVTCGHAGRVGVSGDYALPATVEPIEGSSCLDTDGTCTAAPSFYFQSTERADGHYLNLTVYLPPGAGPGTYALSGDSGARVDGSIHDAAYGSNLVVTTGQVIVTRSDLRGLEATFTMDLRSEDGLHHLTLADGEIGVDGCRVEPVATCVDDNAGS